MTAKTNPGSTSAPPLSEHVGRVHMAHGYVFLVLEHRVGDGDAKVVILDTPYGSVDRHYRPGFVCWVAAVHFSRE